MKLPPLLGGYVLYVVVGDGTVTRTVNLVQIDEITPLLLSSSSSAIVCGY